MVKRAAVDKALYPYSSNWLDLDGHKYHYLDEGPRDATALVMVHGNPTWSFYYRHLIDAFAGDFRVIVPDHIGCGLSAKPTEYPYTIADHIRNLERLITHLNLKKIIWVMHDWGGAIAMGCAGRKPANAAGFVVFNTAAFMLDHVPWSIRICRSDILGRFLVRGLNAFAGMALYLGTSQRARFTPSVKKGYLAPYDSWENRIAIHRFVQEIPLEDDHPTRKTIAEIESGLTQFQNHPMQILWGADDFCFTKKEVLPGWQARFPGAEVHVLPRAGHYVVEDAHERIIPLMSDFIINRV